MVTKFQPIVAVAIVFSAMLSQSVFAQTTSPAQTAWSLFWRSDSLKVNEIVSEEAVQYKKVGHHGPAVENSHSAFRIYFNDSGAIDVYSKSGRGMELEKYKWYPDSLAQVRYGAGCDEYMVGKTVGLGGIALWDGEKEVKLVATKGRTARARETMKGCMAEIIAYGVPYKGDEVDISIRVDVYNKERLAKVTATELNGKKVQFLTGVNYHEGESVKFGDTFIAIWGVHPADVSQNPKPIGAGMFYNNKIFPTIEQTDDMVRIISKPASEVSTEILAASTLEAELSTQKRFESFMMKKEKLPKEKKPAVENAEPASESEEEIENSDDDNSTDSSNDDTSTASDNASETSDSSNEKAD